MQTILALCNSWLDMTRDIAYAGNMRRHVGVKCSWNNALISLFTLASDKRTPPNLLGIYNPMLLVQPPAPVALPSVRRSWIVFKFHLTADSFGKIVYVFHLLG